MITLVYGGSGSGKSKFAENLVLKSSFEKRYYIATMKVYSKEGEERVKKHRKLREGKGFETIEATKDLQDIKLSRHSIVLIECISNLVANEMFQEQIIEKEIVIKRVCEEIEYVSNQVSGLILVSNNIFEDGMEYDPDTENYIEALGQINQYLATKSDVVYEVVVGIPLMLKGEKK